MDDNWDLYAVVRSCSSAGKSTFTTTPTNVFSFQENGFSDLQEEEEEARRNDRAEDLHDMFKVFCPKIAEPAVIYSQNKPSFSPKIHHPICSPLSVLGDLPELSHQKKQKVEPTATFSITHLPHNNNNNIYTTGTTRRHSSHNPKSKRRKNQMKRVCQVPAEGLSSDIWCWRKYGQKPIKGSPYPRGYYRCSTSKGCPARKQVERNRSDPNMFIVTYSSEHNHPIPTHRNSLAGSTRQKPSTSELNKPNCSDSVSPAAEKMDVEVEEEDELWSSDTPLSDDFFMGLEDIEIPAAEINQFPIFSRTGNNGQPTTTAAGV